MLLIAVMIEFWEETHTMITLEQTEEQLTYYSVKQVDLLAACTAHWLYYLKGL